jgi:hypothetical protein
MHGTESSPADSLRIEKLCPEPSMPRSNKLVRVSLASLRVEVTSNSLIE